MQRFDTTTAFDADGEEWQIVSIPFDVSGAWCSTSGAP